MYWNPARLSGSTSIRSYFHPTSTTFFILSMSTETIRLPNVLAISSSGTPSSHPTFTMPVRSPRGSPRHGIVPTSSWWTNCHSGISPFDAVSTGVAKTRNA